MAAPENDRTLHVSANGDLTVKITQVSQDQASNTSEVRVDGYIKNTGNARVSHTDKTISCGITGTQNYNGTPFGFDLNPNEQIDYVGHTFTVSHDANGEKTVEFGCGYGNTNTSYFGNDKYVGTIKLALDRIPKRPSSPGVIQVSNVTPTSVTLSWDASGNNGGKAITSYLLRRWNGSSASGSYVDSSANNLSRTVTGLTPGTTHTFEVYAYNGVKDNDGYSDGRAGTVVMQLAVAYIRVEHVWKMAVPYVRDNGEWKVAVPYTRVGGIWKLTK